MVAPTSTEIARPATRTTAIIDHREGTEDQLLNERPDGRKVLLGLSTRPSQEEWETDTGPMATISLAEFSAPITRPELQILKNAPALSQNRPKVLGNGEPTLVLFGGIVMRHSLLAIVFGALAVSGMVLAQHGGHDKGAPQVKLLSQKDIIEKLDGKKAKATMVEVTLAPGEVEAAHRHPGAAFGYVLEGEYEWAIDGNKPRIFKAGDTFYEPTGCLHDIGRNPSKKDKTRLIAIVLHPEDAKDIVIPEKEKK